MIKVFARVVVVVLVLVGVTACDTTQEPEVAFCNTQYEYWVRKNETGYKLSMRVGRIVGLRDCDHNWPNRKTTFSVERQVSSKEEALKLMEEYREQHITSEKTPVVAGK